MSRIVLGLLHNYNTFVYSRFFNFNILHSFNNKSRVSLYTTPLTLDHTFSRGTQPAKDTGDLTQTQTRVYKYPRALPIDSDTDASGAAQKRVERLPKGQWFESRGRRHPSAASVTGTWLFGTVTVPNGRVHVHIVLVVHYQPAGD